MEVIAACSKTTASFGSTCIYVFINVLCSYIKFAKCRCYSRFQLFPALCNRVTYVLWFRIEYGLIQLVRFFRTVSPNRPFICWHWGWLLAGCMSSLVVLLRPELRRTDSNMISESESRSIQSSQCWEPCFYTKWTMSCLRIELRAAMQSMCANHCTIALLWWIWIKQLRMDMIEHCKCFWCMRFIVY